MPCISRSVTFVEHRKPLTCMAYHLIGGRTAPALLRSSSARSSAPQTVSLFKSAPALEPQLLLRKPFQGCHAGHISRQFQEGCLGGCRSARPWTKAFSTANNLEDAGKATVSTAEFRSPPTFLQTFGRIVASEYLICLGILVSVACL